MMEPGEPDKQDRPALGPAPKRVRKTWGIRFFLVSAALFAIVALLGAQYMPLKYTGTTVFHRHTDPAAEERAGSFETIKLTLEHELSGREAVKEASEELGLTRGFERGADGLLTLNGDMAMRTLVEGVMKNTHVRWPVKSEQVDLISVSFTHDEPDLAQSMPNTLVRKYIAKVHDMIVDRLDKSLKFLKERVGDVDTRLDRAIKGRTVFEGQHAGKITADPGIFERQMQEISAEIDTVRRQLEVAVQERDRLKKIAEAAKANPDAPSQVIRGPNPKLYELKKDLSKYETILDDQFVLEGMTERSPIVQRLRKRIAEIKKEVEETPKEAVLEIVYSSAAKELTMKLASTQSQVDMTTRELKRLEKRLEGPQDLLTGYAPIRQEYLEHLRRCDELESEKANWQIRLTEIQMALSAEATKHRTHLEVVQMAEKQFLPESPSLTGVLGSALLGGLMFSGVLVLIHNVVNRSIAGTLVWLARILDASAVPPAPFAAGRSEAEVEPRRPRAQRIAGRVGRLLLQLVIALILIALLATAILNVTLWLRYPDQYEQWRADPAAYVSEGVHAGIVEPLRERWEAP